MIILGIESSHDDTSIAILENKKVLFQLSLSQVKTHEKFGGTIPEIASREHVKNINILLTMLIEKFDLSKLDYIAYTEKPGLIGALQIGFLFASALSISLNKKLIPINHLEAHFFSSEITNEILYPAVGLVVSGGHSLIYYVKNVNSLEIIGETLDDAIGEVFDKISRKLNLGFPGGPIIDRISSEIVGDIKFTIPKTERDLDFSFSGIKTQVINYINNSKNLDINNVASSFQKTTIDYIEEKLKLAIKKHHPQSLVVGGGVSANTELRKRLSTLHANVLFPKKEYTTDNGAMIAITAFLKLNKSS
ncbi:tRNA (adenosine(37)-N6)-threonylcarbamoyltransferase complex transferase subunit TsaD [[Mycoplasma] mobile]|uniref:tRNA N6-adenosine threonylcarbamoyltransferase n=1 Tax=Mycoplasma mobile (strain ATCC 43663 / 163K / NCTC 11711) TaxID=267748 RepID=TSAD_MYCM1|nr:tRNA (adenosine(37)-N6)-threonylcarbamoyltransferase complex transferase subunit TsaD [[Mycoplasma] mobile]Q6KIG0.1 RecName: Full=tRNA N6-adenosine threonylcarbamoyltransferase; AltName: Full=N6-L-threonylcarbamoyladenine synthase; Short=t(6)A synthase; AltName: Full=t(6)A37 threonylcarbamoyladenosine biosynthesis protein TsaD; AltName: Full=tRNA threonylcarbamoyladenosine biosynthesis protein TsaD [Mycoplasma mobile 163K]AAT27616.1 o-sialoglycoprotein endopeptidase [Mycoplasma mobile 163K]